MANTTAVPTTAVPTTAAPTTAAPTTAAPTTMAPGPLTPHPATLKDFYTTVWRRGVDGKLETLWYDDMACRKEDLLSTVTHTAFRTEKHIEATTCASAEEKLLEEYAPTHDTDWGCIYTEKTHGWFRTRCTIIPHNAVSEAVESMWETPGGAVLILFIVLLCLFGLLWALRCYKQSRFVWPPWQKAQYTPTAKWSRSSYAVQQDEHYPEKEPNNSSSDDESVYDTVDQNKNAFE